MKQEISNLRAQLKDLEEELDRVKGEHKIKESQNLQQIDKHKRK